MGTLLEKDAAFSSTEAPMKAWGSSLRRKVDGTSAMRMSFLDGLLTGTPCKSWKQEYLCKKTEAKQRPALFATVENIAYN